MKKDYEKLMEIFEGIEDYVMDDVMAYTSDLCQYEGFDQDKSFRVINPLVYNTYLFVFQWIVDNYDKLCKNDIKFLRNELKGFADHYGKLRDEYYNNQPIKKQ